MKNLFNQDFKDLINLFNEHEVEYILVGGYAVILHGYSLTTGDIDLWLKRTKENYKKFFRASNKFGLPLSIIDADTFVNDTTIDVFSFGRPPSGLNLRVELTGLNFEDVYDQCEITRVDDLDVRLIDLDNLKAAKSATGRRVDLVDLTHLEQEHLNTSQSEYLITDIEKFDKTAFAKKSFKEADNHRAYWMSRTPTERVVAAYRLSLRAHGIDPDGPHPKIDLTIFSTRKHQVR